MRCTLRGSDDLFTFRAANVEQNTIHGHSKQQCCTFYFKVHTKDNVLILQIHANMKINIKMIRSTTIQFKMNYL